MTYAYLSHKSFLYITMQVSHALIKLCAWHVSDNLLVYLPNQTKRTSTITSITQMTSNVLDHHNSSPSQKRHHDGIPEKQSKNYLHKNKLILNKILLQSTILDSKVWVQLSKAPLILNRIHPGPNLSHHVLQPHLSSLTWRVYKPIQPKQRQQQHLQQLIIQPWALSLSTPASAPFTFRETQATLSVKSSSVVKWATCMNHLWVMVAMVAI